MDLFSSHTNAQKNWLPKEGEVNYRGALFKKDLAQQYFTQLLEEIQWEHDQALIFGKLISTKRKVAHKVTGYTGSHLPL